MRVQFRSREARALRGFRRRSDQSMKRHILVVAYAFPPINRSGAHRISAFVRALSSAGWRSTVLCADGGGDAVDPELERGIPRDCDVVRIANADLVAAIKSWAGRRSSSAGSSGESRRRTSVRVATVGEPRGVADWCTLWLKLPDDRLGWALRAVPSLLKLVRRIRFDAVMSTSPCMSAHPLGRAAKVLTGAPWIADFRDPWTDNPYRTLPFAAHRWVDRRLERSVLGSADRVLFTTNRARATACARSRGLEARSATVPNGYDQNITDGIEPQRPGTRDEFLLTHIGQFYGLRSPMPWLRALRRIVADRQHRSPSAAKPVLVLVGPDHFEGRRLCDLAQESGVTENVRVVGDVSRKEALAIAAGSDALLLAAGVGDDPELQVPAKLFEYIALRKPILGGAMEGSPVRELLQQADADALMCDPRSEANIARAWSELIEKRRGFVAEPWRRASAFSRDASCAALLRIVSELTRFSSRRAPRAAHDRAATTPSFAAQ